MADPRWHHGQLQPSSGALERQHCSAASSLEHRAALKVLLEMMGAREKGVRINVRVPNRAGEIAKLSQAIFNIGGNIIALGTSAGEDPSTSTLTLKVVGPEQEKLRALVEPLVLRLTDIAPVDVISADGSREKQG